MCSIAQNLWYIIYQVWNKSKYINSFCCKTFFTWQKSVISRHINNIYKEGELEKSSTVANFATVQNESGRMVKRNNFL